MNVALKPNEPNEAIMENEALKPNEPNGAMMENEALRANEALKEGGCLFPPQPFGKGSTTCIYIHSIHRES